MSRYMIVSKGASLDKVEKELVRQGAKNIIRHEHVGQISADLDDDVANRLAVNPGISVSAVREIRPMWVQPRPIRTSLRAPLQIAIPGIDLRPYTRIMPAALPTYVPQDIDLVTQAFSELRGYYSPSLTGAGLTVAVLDTGIRKTHNALKGKVVHEFNATSSPTTDDIWGHGTGVAYLICGEDANRVGVSPGAQVMNIKVIDDTGVATTETIVAGINHVIGLVKAVRFAGKSPLDPSYPTIMNISIGGEDTGDAEDPILVAARTAINDWGIDIIAAAGNFGPTRSSITVPAAEPFVIAVGGTETGTVNVWDKSSRGPTLLGDTKPDFMAWATDITVATHRNDTDYDVKSGTSFAAPILSGLTGLLWETGRLQSSFAAPLYLFRWSQIVPYAPYYCIKPSDAAVVKDNTYGYGTPAGGVLMQQMSQQQGAAPQQFLQSMPMLMVMAMMMGIVVPAS